MRNVCSPPSILSYYIFAPLNWQDQRSWPKHLLQLGEVNSSPRETLLEFRLPLGTLL